MDEKPLFSDKMGQRKFTLDSLREKIEEQFIAETSGRADILGELDTRAKRLAALEEAADYVLATEYVTLPAQEKRRIIEQATANIFYFGSLDPYLRDPQISEITIEGIAKTEIRRSGGELHAVEQPFENLYHLERILSAMLAPSGAVLSPDYPFVEVGLNIHDRPARLSLIAPPFSVMYSVQIRLHPPQPLPLDGLIDPALARRLLELLRGGQGMIVSGEVGSGKTTLIAALLNALDAPQGMVVAERAAEMHLHPDTTRLTPSPPRYDTPPGDFSDTIRAAVQAAPRLLVVDEVRGDESAGLWEALSAAHIPHLLIAQRGGSNPARLYSALAMAIQKSYPGVEVRPAVLEKLPYVVALTRGGVKLARWQTQGDGLTLLEEQP